MALDGIMFEGVSVRVRRPNDYNPAAAAALGPAVPNPALNLSAIGLHPGGMNAVQTASCPSQHLSGPLSLVKSCCCFSSMPWIRKGRDSSVYRTTAPKRAKCKLWQPEDLKQECLCRTGHNDRCSGEDLCGRVALLPE